MSFKSDLVDEVKDVLDKMSEDVSSDRVAGLIDSILASRTGRILEKLCDPVVDVHGDAADDLYEDDQDEYDDLVTKYAKIVAESLVLSVCEREGITRSLSEREENRFNTSKASYTKIVRKSEGSGNRRDDRNERRRKRRRGSDDSDSSDRHGASYQRDPVDKDEQPRRSRKEDRNERRSKRKENGGAQVPQGPTISDGDVITAANFAALPESLKDLPAYYVGLEQLVYTDDDGEPKVNLKLLEEQEVDYDDHRTDIYLSPNRKVANNGASIESLEKRLNAAANQRIHAFKLEELEEKENEPKIPAVEYVKVSGNTIVQGVYDFDIPPVGCENQVRDELIEIYGPSVLDKNVVGVTIRHPIGTISKKTEETSEYKKFKETLQSMLIDIKLTDVKTLLDTAMVFLSHLEYEYLHRVLNEAVCNALSCSLKMGIRTDSIISVWDDIDSLIKNVYSTKTWINGIIATNLTAAIPTLLIEKDSKTGLEKISIIRNYVFLPIDKSSFSIGSPIRYATLNKDDRPDLYSVVNKLVASNMPPEAIKSLTTLVTVDNASLSLFVNRDNITGHGYYVFKPING